MSWSSIAEHDLPPDIIKLTCHNKRTCKIVVCQLCDTAWCK